MSREQYQYLSRLNDINAEMEFKSSKTQVEQFILTENRVIANILLLHVIITITAYTNTNGLSHEFYFDLTIFFLIYLYKSVFRFCKTSMEMFFYWV